MNYSLHIFLWIMLACPIVGLSQTDSLMEIKVKPPIHHELSMDVTSFFRQFFSSDSIDFDSPYFLTYKYIRGNRAIRFGIGGRYDRSEKSNEEFADSRIDADRELDLRLGYEIQAHLGGRWFGYFGLDAVGVFGQKKTILDSGIDVITNKVNTQGVGAGPVIGLQFQLTKRLRLSTEGSFYYMFIEEKTFELFQNFPQFNDVIQVDDKQELRVNLPSTIYVSYTF